MTNEELIKKLCDLDGAENFDVASDYNANAWRSVVANLTTEELVELKEHPEFIFDDNSGDPVWERVQDLLTRWETLYYGSPDGDEILSDLRSLLGTSPRVRQVVTQALQIAPYGRHHNLVIQFLEFAREAWEGSSETVAQTIATCLAMVINLLRNHGYEVQFVEENLR